MRVRVRRVCKTFSQRTAECNICRKSIPHYCPHTLSNYKDIEKRTINLRFAFKADNVKKELDGQVIYWRPSISRIFEKSMYCF